ncbi:AFG2-interacting ribosome maturation factor-like [Saccoglossus kowalevskii]|uniref:Uncharacterized protein C1orf109-like n=1 Tax=Saccoglossus kowalevskii TaxID=10224 RepID=A0ABM0GQI6_SACKO|nr:PREDICTED: uncharacterized protein C1orf109-like [Saccoglossus kowalevskii]
MQHGDTLHTELRKSFRIVELQEKKWKETIEASLESLKSLSNLCEQLRSCQQVKLEITPMKNFTDLKERLQYKLTISMEIVMEKLRDRLEILSEVHKQIDKQYLRCMELYQRQASNIGIDRSVERSSTEPSIADMLEWLHDINRSITQQYSKRKFLLDFIQYENLEYVQNLSMEWEKSGTMHDQIGSALAHVTFFMAEYSIS